MIKEYYQLTKPGIVFGNAVTATAGFMLASQGHFNFFLFLAALLGLSFVVAAGCVLNNYFDRLSDQKMARTKTRPLAKGSIAPSHAIIFGFALLFVGVAILSLFTTLLAAFTAVCGFVIYAGFYTVWKYRTVYATEIGSIAGAVPPVVGYTAVTGRFDLAALLLFAIVALWQMPHFFAIAIYRSQEYASASIPVLSLKKGVDVTKRRMVYYMGAFILAALSLMVFGFAGYFYLAACAFLGFYWLSICFEGFKAINDKKWARKVFVTSLFVIVGLCGMIALDTV